MIAPQVSGTEGVSRPVGRASCADVCSTWVDVRGMPLDLLGSDGQAITGPIASGKNTVAELLAKRCAGLPNTYNGQVYGPALADAVLLLVRPIALTLKV